MRETTLVKADKQLVKQAHELGANVRRVVDLALEDYIKRNLVLKPEIRPKKTRSVTQPNGGLMTNDINYVQSESKTGGSSLAWL